MPGGRPRLFKTVKELEDRSDEYFNTIPMDEWTITGLALHLGTYRQQLWDYCSKPEFSDATKRIWAKVEHAYEVSLRKSGKTTDIFALKNFGWQDKQTIENTQDNANNWTPEQVDELKTLAEELAKKSREKQSSKVTDITGRDKPQSVSE
jgi:hypothetical protein